MWQQNPDSLRWIKVEDTISKTSFDFLKQEIETTRLYQVCLSGSSFLNTKDLSNLYQILSYTQSYDWIIGTQSSNYSNGFSTTYSKYITTDTIDEYNKYLKDYAFTLKTKFTPKKLLNDDILNFKQVDVVTNAGLTGIGTYQPGLIINGINLKQDQIVLVKDQTININLSNAIDPSSYFTSSYTAAIVGSSSTTYSVFTSENGLYKYDSNKLVRTDQLDDYDDIYNLSISVKLSNDEEYHLDRLPNGYFPEYKKGESVSFKPKSNYLLRNRVDYNNVYEIYYNDIVKYSSQTFSVAGFTYSIPERTLSIGEFGTIYLHQSGISTVLPNKFKQTLNEITEDDKSYWICGNRGHLLKVSKLNFNIEKVNLDEIHDLTSISFLDNLNAIVVGKFNTIWMTSDAGRNWTKIYKPEFDSLSYTKVIYYKNDKIFLGGEAGTFIEMTKVSNQWSFYKRMIIKDLDTVEPTEKYLLVDDINDFAISSYDQYTWPLNYSFLTQSSVSNNKEVLFIVANGNNMIVKDLNSFEQLFEFKYLSFTNSTFDIKSITPISGSSSVYIAADNIYKLDLKSFDSLQLTSNLITSYADASITHDVYANKIFNYNSQELLIAGNNSLLKYTGLTESISDIDSSFENFFKSKLLFLDYDIASKLNFFDDAQQYRLPSSVGMTAGELGNWLSVENIPGEYNWLNYYKDTEKTFEYYTSFDSSNQVLFSTTFTFSSTSYYTCSSTEITGATYDILPLAPNILSIDSPLVIGSSSVPYAATASKSIFFSRHLIIFKRDTSYSVDKGDVMYLTSDVVSARFIVNKLSTFGPDLFIYCYHDFEQGVINDLLNYSGLIHVTNLNKYASILEIDSKEIIYNNMPIEYPWNYENTLDPEEYFAYAPFNNPDLFGNLLFNFNIHPVSNGYRMTLTDGVYTIEPRFNNKTAYYNMRTKIETEFITDYMQYTDKFLNFGFKPTYNLLDYLVNINPSAFTSSKTFYSMPEYNNLPGNNGATSNSSSIYFDTNPDAIRPWQKNKLLFGEELYFEWDSIWKNTFVDVYMNSDLTERMFVMDKYYDSELDGYVIEFHKELNFTNYIGITSIDILSRRTLSQISDDLQVLNNIQRSSTNRMLLIPTYETDSFVNLNNELNFKFSTDNYAKILLSDRNIKENITAMIFNDESMELCLNVLNLEKQNIQIITNTSAYNIIGTDYLQITTSDKHGLNPNDSIDVIFNGGTGSSEYLNRSYFGFQFVKVVVDEFNFVTDKLHQNVISGTDSGYFLFISRDPYFNFQPVDLMKIGVDLIQKKAIEVEPINVKLSGYTYSLVNLDLTKYRYELVDGLTLTDFYDNYPWALEGNIKDAIIGRNSSGLVWYKGTWECGRWFGGTWLSGTWLSGDWYAGSWNSLSITGNRINPSIMLDRTGFQPVSNNENSKWFAGRWFDGVWNAGTWYGGKLYNVDWKDGIWANGIWNYGLWRNGEFKGGVWIDGIWEAGIFNSDIRPSYWIGGTWKSGDFENGIWYDGNFTSDNGLSRFGTRAFNSRTAIWHGGKFKNSEFHSYLNTDFDGNPIQSEYYKYSQWNAGIFNGGNWYGGLAMAINFNNGNWYGGIVEDIQVIGFEVFTQSTAKWETKITLNGIYYLNVLDEIWIIDEGDTVYNYFGSKENPKKYYVLAASQVDNKTIVSLNRDLHNEVSIIQDSLGVAVTGATSVSDVETGLRVTANFRESNWKSGVWTNGIFESGYFEGGIWYGGNFTANWGR